MPYNHRKKNKARRRKEAAGASYTSVAAGTAHRHAGPPIEPVDGSGFGVERTADMRIASALIGACLEGCKPCQRSLADKVLAGDRLVVASLAGSIYAVLPSAGLSASPTMKAFYPLARDSRDGDGRQVLAYVEGLGTQELEDLLEAALDLWSSAGAPVPTAGGSREAPSGADEAVRDDERRFASASWSCAYLMSAGMEELVGKKQLAALPQVAEASAAGGDPIVCHLCDESIDVLAESEVHIGLTIMPNSGGEVVVPVWTHAGCGRTRVWAWSALAQERRRRGLEADEQFLPGNGRPAGTKRVEDFTMFSVARLSGGIFPLLVVQPGEPHEHGLDGWRADLLSYGLKPVDLNNPDPAVVPEWQARLERGRLTAITRSGAGTWYEQAGGHPTPGEWRQAARRTRSVLLLVVPAGTIDPDADPDGRASLARAAQAGNVLGGVVPVRGSLS